MSFCMHIEGVVCDNCRHLRESRPGHITVTGTNPYYQYLTPGVQELLDRAALQRLMKLLDEDANLRREMRVLLGIEEAR